MDKIDLKKLALMGITGGVMIAAQAPLSADNSSSHIDAGKILAAKCGSNGSCGGSSGSCGSHSCSSSHYSQYQNSCGSRCGGTHQPNRWGGGYFADNDDNAPQDNSAPTPMTENDFKGKLSPQAKADFDKLSPEGKANAIKMVSHDCSGKNDCKGQNSCKTDKNTCAGQGGCKGQSKCAMTPEQAVKASSLKDKRTSLNNRNPSQNTYR